MPEAFAIELLFTGALAAFFGAVIREWTYTATYFAACIGLYTVMAWTEHVPIDVGGLVWTIGVSAGGIAVGRLIRTSMPEQQPPTPFLDVDRPPPDSLPRGNAQPSPRSPVEREAATRGRTVPNPHQQQVKGGEPSSWGKVNRNALCPCGSGKRYKHCHGVLA